MDFEDDAAKPGSGSAGASPYQNLPRIEVVTARATFRGVLISFRETVRVPRRKGDGRTWKIFIEKEFHFADQASAVSMAVNSPANSKSLDIRLRQRRVILFDEANQAH